MVNKVLYFDVETTGLDPKQNDILQLAYIVEINGEVKEKGSFYMQPFSYVNIRNSALEINKLELAQIKKFDLPEVAYNKLITILDKYVDKYNKNDKFCPSGYNVHFDMDFLREFFKKNGNKYFGSYFDYHSIDPLQFILGLEYKGILTLPSHKLVAVAEYFGIPLDAHNALSDIEATREVWLTLVRDYLPEKKEEGIC